MKCKALVGYRAFLALVVAVMVALASLLFLGFTRRGGESSLTSTSSPTPIELLVGAATTLYNAGLVQYVLEGYKNESGHAVEFRFLVRGSGDLLRALSDGSICIAFTHAPLLERMYIEEGKVEWWGPIAYNRFVIVGPRGDPLNVKSAKSVVEAFKKIFEGGEAGLAKFISRGDLSGTNVRELQIWSMTGLKPEERSWYLKSARGAPETVRMAADLNAYTFIDEGTFRVMKSRGLTGDLEILYEGWEPLLLNVYSMLTSKHENCKSLKPIIESIVDYIRGRGQSLIESKFAKLGQFYPASSRSDLNRFWEELSRMSSS